MKLFWLFVGIFAVIGILALIAFGTSLSPFQ
jgi:uncharacterized membrane protein